VVVVKRPVGDNVLDTGMSLRGELYGSILSEKVAVGSKPSSHHDAAVPVKN